MKEEIVNGMKLAVLLLVLGLGIPTGWWAGLTVTALTIASEYGFITWLEG